MVWWLDRTMSSWHNGAMASKNDSDGTKSMAFYTQQCTHPLRLFPLSEPFCTH
jgi:hypothetical protein